MVQYKFDYVLQPADTKAHYTGLGDWAARFLLDEQIMDKALWARFVQAFRDQIDGIDRGWRGEFWGKTMRGAAMIYEYTQNEELYATLTETVEEVTFCEVPSRYSTKLVISPSRFSVRVVS